MRTRSQDRRWSFRIRTLTLRNRCQYGILSGDEMAQFSLGIQVWYMWRYGTCEGKLVTCDFMLHCKIGRKYYVETLSVCHAYFVRDGIIFQLFNQTESTVGINWGWTRCDGWCCYSNVPHGAAKRLVMKRPHCLTEVVRWMLRAVARPPRPVRTRSLCTT
jgi:hypothetical protein